MKEEVEIMEINRLKDLAEMEQLRFFSTESEVMISQLLMNNQQLQTKKEQSEIDLRHMREESDLLQDELKNLEAEKKLLEEQVSKLESEEVAAKITYEEASSEQEELRTQLGIKTRRWPRFLRKNSNTAESGDAYSVCSAPVFSLPKKIAFVKDNRSHSQNNKMQNMSISEGDEKDDLTLSSTQ